MRGSLTPEEKLFNLAFEGVRGGKHKASFIGGLPGRSNETGICINGHPFALLEAYIRNKDIFWNEENFNHGLYMMPAYGRTQSRFVLVTKDHNLISSSFDANADLTCFAFFVSGRCQNGGSTPVISLKGVFNKSVSAVTSVEDPEIYKLWRLEAKQMEEAFAVHRSQGGLVDESDFDLCDDEDEEYEAYEEYV